MALVNDLLRKKSSDIWSVGPETTVFAALQLMAEKNIGAVLVKQDEQLVGLISERDYARKLVLEDRSSRDTPVRDVMTEHIAYATPSMDIEECLAVMTDKHFRHMPVMDDNKLVGLISIGDLVKAIIEHKEFMIEQLEHYIAGQ